MRLATATILVGLLMLFASRKAPAIESTWVYAVQISATVQSSPPRITLSWPQDQYGVNNYTVYRKAKDATSWGSGTTLPGSATSYVDNNVVVGGAYEYQIVKAASGGYTGYGYIYAGIEAPLIETRGKVILVVDSSQAASLTVELNRLQQDLVGDGWTVIRRDVSRSDSPANIRNVIRTEYNADSANVKAVFLFGHIPILRSGSLDVDGHGGRNMPADGFYGDMDGTWSNPNTIPSDIELMVGRVDLFDMPVVGRSETELLRNYLNKDHNWRHKRITAPRRGLMGNLFGDANREAYAASGYRNFEPFLGPGNTVHANEQYNAPDEQKWSSMLTASTYLWAYGCGAGSYTSMSGMGTHGSGDHVWSSDIIGGDARAVFFMMFGSWLGEWDSRDNIMRAVLATPTMGLTCSWAGRPHWYYHHMALGEPIGHSARLTQNNNGLYRNHVNLHQRGVHIALMGDPTLRMHPVAPPTAVTATPVTGGTRISWTASADSVLGYYVYRSSSGPYTRLSTALSSGNSFVDTSAGAGPYTYMVRAVKLENTPSGTYYNGSQGAFSTGSSPGDTIPPLVTISAPGNNTVLSGSNVQITATATDNVGVVGVQFQIDGANVGSEVTSAPYGIIVDTTSITTGLHQIVAIARDAAGNRATSSAISVVVSNQIPGGDSGEIIWFDDMWPAGASTNWSGGDSWNWVTLPVYSGLTAHQSTGTGNQQHLFSHAAETFQVNTGDVLITYVYLDPASPPQQVMLQWNNGSWEHRAYWGASINTYGVEGTASRRAMGPLPALGRWVRLEVPASLVGLEGSTLKGMAFTLYNGRATWDRTGKLTRGTNNAPPITLSIDRAEEGLRLTWNSASDIPYRVQYTTDLANPQWLDITQLTSAGASTSWIETNRTDRTRFYRVVGD